LLIFKCYQMDSKKIKCFFAMVEEAWSQVF
jgi:hypothetical protein